MRNRSAGYVKLKCDGCMLFFLAPVGSEESLCIFCKEKPLWLYTKRDRKRLLKMLRYERDREKILAQERVVYARKKAARTPTPALPQMRKALHLGEGES
jgi:hypothetical protein